MKSRIYYPIIKTTISELRAFNNVDQFENKNIKPIFELTKSRKSKNNQGGDVSKRIDDIKSIVKDGEFILDLTSEESLSNDQIESMFNEDDDFVCWREFVLSLRKVGHNVIPIIQAYDDSTEEELLNQMIFFDKHCDHFAVRIKSEFFGLPIVEKILSLASKYKYLLIIDFSYIKDASVELLVQGINFLKSLYNFDALPSKAVICSSSFPPMVVHNNANFGEFETFEFTLFESITNSFPNNDFPIFYGDYASVHPYRNDVTAYNWVPRIDYPINRKVIFYRYQRDIGGYKKCAVGLNVNPAFKNTALNCWGYSECKQAAVSPNGKSPSYWISVRINIHIHRVLDWIGSNKIIF